MTKEKAREILTHNWTRIDNPNYSESELDEAFFMAIESLSTEATKKKAKLKENGDWDCPDVYCDGCDHHRSVEWCSLAIPNHEEIDDTYKMVNEAFFKGFDAAEKQYRLLIEEVEELEKKSADADVVRCKDCRHYEKFNYEAPSGYDGWCNTPVIYADGHYTNALHFCSYGERREP